MAALARKLLLREFKRLENTRKLSTCVVSKKNDEFLIKSNYSDFEIPNERFLDHLWKFTDNFGNHVAIQCADSHKAYTYHELRRNMAAFGTSLRQKLGLRADDVVSAMLPNMPEFPVVALGTMQAGCRLTTVSPIYKEYEISTQTALTEPKVMVTIPECYDIVCKGLAKANVHPKIVLIDRSNTALPAGTIRYSDIAENSKADYGFLDTIEKSLEDVAMIPFSSGTTGHPKGVEITYKNLIASLEMMIHDDFKFPHMTHGNHQDALPCILPFFHIYGFIVQMLGHLRVGCKLVAVPKFTANGFFNVLKNEKISLLYVVPPVAILLGKHPEVNEDHFQHLRHIVCGAAPLSASDVQSLFDKSKKVIQFHQGYGATETTSLATTTPKHCSSFDVDYAAAGVAMPGVSMNFRDPLTGQLVPAGQPGEVYIKSHTIMKGYFKNEEATRDSLAPDGFFRTGDLGHYQPGKGLYITERIKELIKVKGIQVAPAELEGILRTHPEVSDAAVIGIPHDFYGEVPKAFVIPKTGAKINEEELIKFVADQVADFKRIAKLIFVKDIPKTPSGKISRKDLKAMYAS